MKKSKKTPTMTPAMVDPAPAMTPEKDPTPTAFQNAMEEFTQAYITRKKDPDLYGKTLFDLGLFGSRIIMKKVNDPTLFNLNNPNSKSNSADLLSDSLDLYKHFSEGEKESAIKGGFNPILTEMRRDSFRAVEILEREKDPNYKPPTRGEDLGEGLDLANYFSMYILDELEKQAKRDPDLPPDLTRPYELTRLKKKVYIRSQDLPYDVLVSICNARGETPPTLEEWKNTREGEDLGDLKETVTTSPIEQAFSKTRGEIENSRAVQADPRNGYSYIEYECNDPDLAGEIMTYLRLPKYADIGGSELEEHKDHLTPILTKSTPTYADKNTAESIGPILEDLKLTDSQLEVVHYRLRGYGCKAIATRIGIKKESVKDRIEGARKKWKKSGRPTPAMIEEEKEKDPRPGAPRPAIIKRVVNGKTEKVVNGYYPQFIGPTPRPAWYKDPAPRPEFEETVNGKQVYKDPIQAPVITSSNTFKYKVMTPAPVITNPSVFGKLAQNKVVNGQLVGSNGKTPDSWL